MRVKGATIQYLLLGLALLAGVLWNLAQAGEIKDLRVEAGATGTRAEIRLDREAAFQVLSLSNPDRLVIDLPGTSFARGVAPPAANGLVEGVRTGQPVPGTARIVFDLASPVVALKPRFEQGAGGTRLVVEWPGDGTGAASKPIAAAPPAPPPANSAASTEAAPKIDPAVSSSAATSRLIAQMARDGQAAQAAREAAASPASTASASSLLASPQPKTIDPSRSVPDTNAQIREGSGTVASGVPTRIATGQPTPASPTPATAGASAQAPVRTMQDVMRRGGLRPLVIAIDAGHGGQDPGARGPNGTREKDVTLQIAKELARQVNATPGLKAYLTRDSDFFIPLAQRYQKARKAKADLFVSIHADAFNKASASGSSVFVLSQRGASSQAAKWLASQENAADLVGGVRLHDKDDTLASVLLDLSQSATMKASEDMANHVLSGLKRLGKTHKPHVERANFVVLRSPDVPSMLVETAFITNPEEERRLRDPGHQRKLASAILDGVNTYFTRQPPPGTLYAARASAEGGAVSAGGGSP
jgi:N-acetylmuramoyl-L-alanine amidase